MLQSRASVAKDVAPMSAGAYRAVLYIDVPDIATVRSALGDWPLVVPERKTFYGATELIVNDPAGNFVFFSQH